MWAEQRSRCGISAEEERSCRGNCAIDDEVIHRKVMPADSPRPGARRAGFAKDADVIGADIAATTNFLSTPLHLAAKDHHFPIVQLLVRRGADVSAREVDYEGPLKHAQSDEMVDFLLNEGAW